MASSTTSIQFNLRSTADTSGVKQMEQALGIVERSEKELAARRAQFLSAAEAEVAEVNRLTEAARRLAASQASVNSAVAVNPWTTASRGVQVNHEAINRLNNAHEVATRSTRNHAQSLLYFSQGLEDAQYGIRGVLNNIPQLVMSLGGGAGLAGAISIAAVAAVTAGPKILEFFKQFDAAADKKEFIDAMIKQLGGVPEVTDKATIAGERFAKQQTANKEAVRRVNEALNDNLKLIELQLAAQKSENAFRTEQAIQDVKAQKLPDEEARIAAIRIKAAQEEKRLADEAAQAQLFKAANARDAAQAEAERATKEAEKQKKQLALAEQQRFLLGEQLRLEEQLAKWREVAAMSATGSGIVDPAMQQRVQEAQAAVDANAAAQAALFANPMANGDASKLRVTAPEAQKAAEEARKNAGQLERDAQQMAREEALKAEERARELARTQQRATREAAPGVYGANLAEPASPFGPAPLPSGQVFAPGQAPAAPFGPAPLPSGGGFKARPPSPFGPAPLPGGDLVPAVQQMAESNSAANEAVLAAFKKLEEDNAKLKEQLKNSRR